MKLISEDNLSLGWAKALLALSEPGIDAISPLVMEINVPKGDIVETPAIRERLDQSLKKAGKNKVETVANTIFPNSLWNPARPADSLFSQYGKMVPLLKKMHPANRKGLYFERMIEFPNGKESVNQLAFILQTWKKGNHRRSALQLSTVDPRKDLTHSRILGFPCLQQLAVVPLGKNGEEGFSLNAFYGLQYFFEKAYGNYLGLLRLGKFMEHYLRIPFIRLVCISSTAVRGGLGKEKALSLINAVKRDGVNL